MNLHIICSKLIYTFILPSHLIVFLLGILVIFLYLRKWQIARFLSLFIFLSIWTITVYPVGDWLLYPLENTYPANPTLPDTIEGIIILGGAEDVEGSLAWNQYQVNSGADRFLQGAYLAKQYPKAKVIFTGTQDASFVTREKGSEIVQGIFKQLGIDNQRLICESSSRNTYENALLTTELISASVRSKPWILVTSAYHMPRAVPLFQKLGWSITPYPVDYISMPPQYRRLRIAFGNHIRALDIATKEWLGLIGYKLITHSS